MRSLLTKLSILLVGLIGLMVYQQWDRVGTRSLSSLGELIPGEIKNATTDRVTTTRVYRWRDAQGKLHVSDMPPTDGSVATSQDYRSDQNVVPGQPVPQSPSTETGSRGSARSAGRPSPANPGGRPPNQGQPSDTAGSDYLNALEKARASRQALEQRNSQVQERLNQ